MDIVEISGRLAEALRSSAVAVLDRGFVAELSGPGATSCLQGLHTNDVGGGGPATLVYGGFLSPKGMILADAWAARAGSDHLVFADEAARPSVIEMFSKRIPPRLARATDRSDDWRLLFFLGPSAARIAELATGQALPAPGQVTRRDEGDASLWIGTPPGPAPFGAMMAGPTAQVERLVERAVESGAQRGDRAAIRAGRVLAGWPTLGAEIGERALPQEVGFDELGGVSYEKGCYVGQETVARIHFRGHPNWRLRSLRFGDGVQATPSSDDRLRLGGQVVGTVTTVLAVDGRIRRGLAIVRREVELGAAADSPIGPTTIDATGEASDLA